MWYIKIAKKCSLNGINNWYRDAAIDYWKRQLQFFRDRYFAYG